MFLLRSPLSAIFLAFLVSLVLVFQFDHELCFLCHGMLQLGDEPTGLQRSVELFKVFNVGLHVLPSVHRSAAVFGEWALHLLLGALDLLVAEHLSAQDLDAALLAGNLLEEAIIKVRLREPLESFPFTVVARNHLVNAFVLVRFQVLVDSFPRASVVLARHFHVSDLTVDVGCGEENGVVGVPFLFCEREATNGAGIIIFYVLLHTLLAEQVTTFGALCIA